MAQKKKVSQASDSSTVTRIKATDAKPVKKDTVIKQPSASQTKSASAEKSKVRKPRAKGLARPFAAAGRYFKGAWYELKQVRWPTRRATWGLTAAVLMYTAFFIVVVILLDILFKYLFDLMLGK